MKRLSLAALLGVLCYTILLSAGLLTTTAGAHVRYHSVRRHAKRLEWSRRLSSRHATAASARAVGRTGVLRFRSPGGADPANRGAAAQLNRGIGTASSGVAAGGSAGGTLNAFNGLSSLDSDNLNSFPDTPPDQGLCVGADATLPGSPTAVIEAINSAVRETSPSGKLLRPDATLGTLFSDPYNLGDPRCLYDPATRSFYFTEIGYPVATGPIPDGNNTTVDVTVMNANGVASYQFDTSLDGNCFGDQPKTGFDNNALVISTDEYCGPAENVYEGAIVLALSKSQLVAEDASIGYAQLGPVSLAGIPVTGLDPAINTGNGTEYLVNSFPFLADGSNNPVGDTLGVWTLSNDASIASGGTPTLSAKVVASEPYAFPVPATSTGDGSTKTANTSVGPLVVTSEPALNPDDSRLSAPVNVVRPPSGGIRLWTALDAAVTPSGDSVARDGAAWFQIDPTTSSIVSQGYIASKGAYLLYPAVAAGSAGRPLAVFTITSSTINPSAAFARVGTPKITTVAAGAGPHWSFSDAPPFNEPRWGDYSWALADPSGKGAWLATEYIPPMADWDPADNWGTYVFQLPTSAS